jgi:hypothetical protein
LWLILEGPDPQRSNQRIFQMPDISNSVLLFGSTLAEDDTRLIVSGTDQLPAEGLGFHVQTAHFHHAPRQAEVRCQCRTKCQSVFSTHAVPQKLVGPCMLSVAEIASNSHGSSSSTSRVASNCEGSHVRHGPSIGICRADSSTLEGAIYTMFRLHAHVQILFDNIRMWASAGQSEASLI